MLEFLSEGDVAKKYQERLKAEGGGRVAVAFWGNSGLERLVGKQTNQPLRVICNLASGACNPAAIRDLKKVKGLEVRKHPRLHAKVYLTSKTAIVGSSNVSTNGLVIEDGGTPGWVEANLLCQDQSMVEQVSEWFDDLWQSRECSKITEGDIKEAEETWKRRKNESIFGPERPATILSAIRSNPTAFEAIPLFLLTYDDDMSDEGVKVVQEEKRKRPSEKIEGFEGFELDEESWIIECSMKNPTRPKVGALYYVPGKAEGIRRRGDVDIAFRKRLLTGYGKPLQFPPAERRLLEKLLVRWRITDDVVPFTRVWASLNKV